VPYPTWAFFPRQSPAPDWVAPFLTVVAARRTEIDSHEHVKMDSDDVVKHLRDLLVADGWQIEAGKTAVQKIHRPVLFGDNGSVRVKQELDGWHPDRRIVLEIESGRAVLGNAIYRDMVRASLVAEAEYLALGVRQLYSYKSSGKVLTQNDFEKTRDALDSVYASGRLVLPFKGVLLFGW
jgi:hypothetical protein